MLHKEMGEKTKLKNRFFESLKTNSSELAHPEESDGKAEYIGKYAEFMDLPETEYFEESNDKAECEGEYAEFMDLPEPKYFEEPDDKVECKGEYAEFMDLPRLEYSAENDNLTDDMGSLELLKVKTCKKDSDSIANILLKTGCSRSEEVDRERISMESSKNQGGTYNANKKITYVSKDLKMAELEGILRSRACFKIINGSLCVWNGQIYRQLDSMLFLSEVRKYLKEDEMARLSNISKIKDTFNFMLADKDSKMAFSDKNLKKVKRLIAFKNGIFDGKSAKLKDFKKNYPVLFQIQGEYIDNCEDEHLVMDDVINAATNDDKEVLELFYEMLGYIISQGADAKKFFLIAPARDSGKSVIGEFLVKLLGEDNVSNNELHRLGERFSLGAIAKTILNYNMDLTSQSIDENSVSKLKQLTGDRRILSEQKYEQSRMVYHNCKFLFGSNQLPCLKKYDEAFYNRLILIPFINSKSNDSKDYDLLSKLWKERNLISSKAALAFHRLYKNNFVFTESRLATTMIEECIKQEGDNFIKDFVNERCIIDKEQLGNTFTPTESLFRAFQEYSFKKNMIIGDDKKKGFSKDLHEIYDLKKDKKRVEGYNSPVNGFLGIKLVD